MNVLKALPTEELLYVMMFIGLLLVFEGVRQILSRSETDSEARGRRMKMIAAGMTAKERLALLKPRADDWALARVPVIGVIPSHLRQAGLSMKPGLFLSLCTAIAMVLFVFVSVLFGPVLSALVTLGLGFGVPILILRKARDKRISRLVSQLPDALELMARGLRVGHPLSTTLTSVADEMADPIGTEFGILVDQVSYGDELTDATGDLAKRIDQEDVHYFAAAISIQHGTGSDLSDVLNTLSKVIRDRIQMRRKVKAISAEGRLTAVFLSLLPFIIFTMTMISSPGYYGQVMDDPLFRPGAVIVVTLVVANYLVMRRLVNFRF